MAGFVASQLKKGVIYCEDLKDSLGLTYSKIGDKINGNGYVIGCGNKILVVTNSGVEGILDPVSNSWKIYDLNEVGKSGGGDKFLSKDDFCALSDNNRSLYFSSGLYNFDHNYPSLQLKFKVDDDGSSVLAKTCDGDLFRAKDGNFRVVYGSLRIPLNRIEFSRADYLGNTVNFTNNDFSTFGLKTFAGIIYSTMTVTVSASEDKNFYVQLKLESLPNNKIIIYDANHYQVVSIP